MTEHTHPLARILVDAHSGTIHRAALTTFFVVSGLLTLGGACTPAPCCVEDGDCSDGRMCVEGLCSVPCTSDDDCSANAVCATSSSAARVGTFCVIPGGVPAGECPVQPLPVDDAGVPVDAGPDAGFDCEDDRYEPNDDRDTATVNAASGGALNICPDDEDYFRLALGPNQGARVRIDFNHAAGDLDLLGYVEGEPGAFIASTSTFDFEEIEFPTSGGVFFARVFGWAGSRNDYAITFDIDDVSECNTAGEPNDNFATATPMPNGVFAGAICPPGDEDVFEITGIPGTRIYVTSTFTHNNGDLDLSLKDATGFVIDASTGTGNLEFVEGVLPSTGFLFASVFGFNGAVGPFVLSVEFDDGFCGNGVIDGNEQCDDGNLINGDGCSSTCVTENPAVCGNGVLEGNEQCDDGNLVNGDGCSSTCQVVVPPLCGNGVLNGNEQCDDGNNVSGDGCAANCVREIPVGWTCFSEWYGDGFCDCGCSVVDSDCPSLSIDACDYENCAPGFEVVPNNNPICVLTGCGDGVLAPNTEQCDDGNNTNGDGCSAVCTLEAQCGNGVVEPPLEQCDDGNNTNGDGCSQACLNEVMTVCGNGILQPPFEQCDDGNTTNGDGCSSSCLFEALPVCGDGILQPPFEQCDDGNLVPGDGCSPNCAFEGMNVCGNGVVEPPFEQCDDGNLTAGDGCSPFCTSESPPFCGNGQLDDFEQCDDGNTENGDGCSAFCLPEIPPTWTCVPWYFGDGVCDCGCGALDSDCDSLSSDVCEFNNCPGDVPPVTNDNTRCTLPGCGNTIVEPPFEQCDDGNLTPGDGCSASCQNEAQCGNGAIEGGEQCDDGNLVSGDGCSAGCTIETLCGNGVLEPPFEQCDDGNNQNGDGCSSFCTFEGMPFCGNGIVEPPFEQCDDGNNQNGDGCSAFCESEVPLGWTCPTFWYGDNLCDCGCGVLDVDCPSLSANDCEFNNCPGVEPVPNNNPQCLIPSCGNGIVDDEFEQCDDGNLTNGDGCNINCQLEPACGNGFVEPPFEECDDGNLVGGDGCSSSCTAEIPPEWICEPSWFGDGICDCGCGVLDVDCPDTSADVCGFNNCESPQIVDPNDNSQCIDLVCPDDFFEDNDTAQTGTGINDGTLTNAVLCPNDVDFFTFFAPSNASITVTLQYTAPPSMTLRVARPGVGLIDQVTGGGGFLSVTFDSTFDGPVAVRVSGNSVGAGVPRPYAILVSVDDTDICEQDDFEPNDDPFQAPDIAVPAFIEANACVDDVDIFRLPFGTSGTLFLELRTDNDTDLVAVVVTPDFDVIGVTFTNGGPTPISLPPVMGQYLVAVASGQGESYALDVFTEP